jgi:hypothetical protein
VGIYVTSGCRDARLGVLGVIVENWPSLFSNSSFLCSTTAKIVNCTELSLHMAARVDKVFSSFEAHQIQLVEWENYLLRRLDYPTVASVSISTRLIYVISNTVDG